MVERGSLQWSIHILSLWRTIAKIEWGKSTLRYSCIIKMLCSFALSHPLLHWLRLIKGHFSTCWAAVWSVRAAVFTPLARDSCFFCGGERFLSVPPVEVQQSSCSHWFWHEVFTVHTEPEVSVSHHDVTFSVWPTGKRKVHLRRWTQACFKAVFKCIECLSFNMTSINQLTGGM